jgi:hypothetical protein
MKLTNNFLLGSGLLFCLIYALTFFCVDLMLGGTMSLLSYALISIVYSILFAVYFYRYRQCDIRPKLSPVFHGLYVALATIYLSLNSWMIAFMW